MSRHRRKGKSLGSGKVLDCGYCPEPCGKLRFDGKADAKVALKQRRHGLDQAPRRMHVYRCHVHPRYWHFGHVPSSVIAGEVARADVSGMRGRRPESR